MPKTNKRPNIGEQPWKSPGRPKTQKAKEHQRTKKPRKTKESNSPRVYSFPVSFMLANLKQNLSHIVSHVRLEECVESTTDSHFIWAWVHC